MGELLNRVKWGAIGALALAVAGWVWPVVTDVLTLLTGASWAVVAGVLLRGVPLPARARTVGPELAGRAQRAAAGLCPPRLRERLFPGPWTRPALPVVDEPAQLPAPVA